MTENDLLGAVLDMARLFGLPVAHFRTALSQTGRWHTAVAGGGKGYPDLTIAGTEVLFRELKSEVGRLAPDQVEWLRRLELAGANVGIWRPRDLRSGLIGAELRAIRFADSAKSLADPRAGVSARSADAKRKSARMKQGG